MMICCYSSLLASITFRSFHFTLCYMLHNWTVSFGLLLPHWPCRRRHTCPLRLHLPNHPTLCLRTIQTAAPIVICLSLWSQLPPYHRPHQHCFRYDTNSHLRWNSMPSTSMSHVLCNTHNFATSSFHPPLLSTMLQLDCHHEFNLFPASLDWLIVVAIFAAGSYFTTFLEYVFVILPDWQVDYQRPQRPWADLSFINHVSLDRSVATERLLNRTFGLFKLPSCFGLNLFSLFPFLLRNCMSCSDPDYCTGCQQTRSWGGRRLGKPHGA